MFEGKVVGRFCRWTRLFIKCLIKPEASEGFSEAFAESDRFVNWSDFDRPAPVTPKISILPRIVTCLRSNALPNLDSEKAESVSGKRYILTCHPKNER